MNANPDEGQTPQKPPEILDKIADVVLGYRPKDKQPASPKKKRKRKPSEKSE